MKKLFILFLIPLFIGFVACSDDDDPIVDPGQGEESEKEKEPELEYIDSATATFMENGVITMYNYSRMGIAKTDFMDSTEPNIAPGNNRYYLCKDKTVESEVPLFVKYHAETDDHFLSTTQTLDDNDYKKGGVVKENPGYMFKEYRLGLVPLDEYYSKKNDDIRYFVSKYDVKNMRDGGGDYEYVKTLGYVFPGGDYNVPKTPVRINNNSALKHITSVFQVMSNIYLPLARSELAGGQSAKLEAPISTRLLMISDSEYREWVVVPEGYGLEINIDEDHNVSLSLIKPEE